MILIFSCQHSTSLKQRKLKRGHFFFFLPKIWKHFVLGVDFQPNEYLHRNGRNHTLCSSILCLPGHIALLWISTIWEKVSEKTWDLLWCCKLLSINREMCPLASLPGKNLKMRCLCPWCLKFCAKPGLYCKTFTCQLSFIKNIRLFMPKNNIMEKPNQLAMFDHRPKEFSRIPQNSKLCIF